PSWLNSTYGRATILLANPQSLSDQLAQQVEVARLTSDTVVQEGEMALEAPAAATMDSAGFDKSAAGLAANAPDNTPIQIRSDFNPLAEFEPAASTDSDGRATIDVTLPDNLTRYRVMVVAVHDGKLFGMGESNVTARLPLMVRPSAPRFLNFGDVFEFPVVLQNQTDEPMDVDVVMQTSNLSLTGSQGVRVSVPANDRVEVRFPAAADLAGTARFQVAAVSGRFADAASGELPVYTPATTEAFATNGVIDQGAIAQPIVIPDGLFPQFGGLEINTSSTALQSLTDAVLYLVSYRYECSEQLASRILAVAALRDVLTAFEADGLPTPEEMETAVQRDIERLAGLQNFDGGFPIWERGRESIPYYTIHVTHALVRARQKGFDVPENVLANALNYLRDIESYYPSWYSDQTRWSMSAYALNVRHLAGDSDPAKAANLLNEAGLEKLSLEALAWLWPILDDAGSYGDQVQAIYRHFQNRVVETAGAANFTTSYGDQEYLMLHSNRRTDGIILDALIAVDPESDLIPKLVNGLLAHRTRGRWRNTQENVFILLALDNYFNTFEAQMPDFVAQVWLGDTYAAEHTFVGRTTERRLTEIPMPFLVEQGETEIILNKEGDGRLYYRLGLNYAPDDLELEPLDMGFTVLREYEGVDNPDDVYRDSDGVWHIKAGARVRVRLTLVASNRRYHVALVDPLPAGLETMNPALAVTGDLPQDVNAEPIPWWWWGPWYEHQNLRDERAEAFTTLLWEGVHEYSYVARATTPGTFVVPPAKAEEMYSPEVFGRSASELVIVE
ncbi:MAG: alpha-2-macroglobulin, partial [Anaerolineae bacterium]